MRCRDVGKVVQPTEALRGSTGSETTHICKTVNVSIRLHRTESIHLMGSFFRDSACLLLRPKGYLVSMMHVRTSGRLRQAYTHRQPSSSSGSRP